MPPCHSPDPPNASFPRRSLLIGAASLGLTACHKGVLETASRTPPLDVERLDKSVAALAERAKPGILGVGLINLESGQNWSWAGDRRFPMQSVFKAVLAAAALAEVDANRLSLAEIVTLTDKQLSPPHSPIADAWPARRDYTIEELLNAAVSDSDNTAADVLMKRIGGPGAVTAWLQAKRLDEIRIDRYERELQPDVYGMASFRAAWKGAKAFDAARATVAPSARMKAMTAYMVDPRDTATPRGMATFLSRLDAGEMISQPSTRRLLTLMAGLPGAADRLKAGLPPDARFAHKPGTSGTDQGLTPAFNDVGIFTLADRRSYAVAAFLSGSTAGDAARAALLADLARALVGAVG